MSKTYKRVDAALKGMRHLEIIKELRENEAARDGVLKWIVENNYEKLYQRCEYEPSSDKCVGVGLRSTFHGKKCPSCRREYRNQTMQLRMGRRVAVKEVCHSRKALRGNKLDMINDI